MSKKSILLTVLAAAACSPGDQAGDERALAPSASAGETIETVRLYTLDCGRIEMLDLSIFAQGEEYEGRTNSAVDTCFVVRHPDGDLVWDAGLPDALFAREEGVAEGAFRVSMPVTLAAQIRDLGMGRNDIEFFSISHSHFDHIGNGNYFAEATFLIHEDERAYMFRDEARESAENFSAYSDLENSETVTFTREHDVFGDGAVMIVPTPGHTPGHSSLLVRLKNAGPVLLTGDLYHFEEARDKRTVPSFNTDVEQTLESMEAFERLARRENARVIIQHSKEDYESLPRLPGYLD